MEDIELQDTVSDDSTEQKSSGDAIDAAGPSSVVKDDSNIDELKEEKAKINTQKPADVEQKDDDVKRRQACDQGAYRCRDCLASVITSVLLCSRVLFCRFKSSIRQVSCSFNC